LKIVTATFSPSLFDEHRSDASCSDSEIEGLGCFWVAIMQKLKEMKPDSDGGTEEIVIALARVSFQYSERIFPNFNIVVQICSGDYEQHGQ
jgi:hypothetical protein